MGRHDSPRLLAFVGAHAVPGVEAWDGTVWTSSLHLPHGPGVLQVSAADRGYDVRLRLSDPADEPVAVARLVRLLDLDRDVAAAEAHLGADPVLAPLVARRPGLRVPAELDAFETLVRTIIGQQISVSGARTVTARLVRAAGTALPPALQLYPDVTHTFPLARTVAALDPDGEALAMPRARARAVVAAGWAFADREPGGGAPSRAELLALPGIGPWTADYLDLRVRRDPDVLMVTDLAVRRALEALGVRGSAQVAAVGETWRPFRSTALMHLWAEYLHL
ncbi:DNA-3-methyladenine glycosylase family protein [Angustibacter luteus]|uniref:DNA-3-methyladenine glycosylase II n=1 Tax=Angustibacter luteus TaxID=658456 RepID=A0ABW1JE03_9ACTN